MKCSLPKELKPIEKTGRLVRLGSTYDGGYICLLDDILGAEVVVSGGINNNWDFEIEFQKLNKAQIHCYDASIGLTYFVKQLIEVVPKVHRWNLIYKRIKNLARYLFRYPSAINIHRKFLGITENRNFVNFEDILEEYSKKSIFLKLDIEGWEYRLLSIILRRVSTFKSIVIEFHDADLHIREIINFAQKTNMDIVSLSVNSYSSLGVSQYPTTIEVTFSQRQEYNLFNTYKSLVHPNHKSHEIWEIEYV